MERDIVFLILQYNMVDVTVNCIRSILQLDDLDRIQIVIVDNGSIDDAAKEILGYMRNEGIELGLSRYGEDNVFLFKHKSGCLIDILCRSVNNGFSRGNNCGFQYIKTRYLPKFLIVANSDVEFVQKDILEQIDREYEKTDFDVMGPDIWVPHKRIHQNPLALEIPTQKEVGKTIYLNRLCLLLYPITYPFLKKYMNKVSKNSCGYTTDVEGICLHGACLIYSHKYLVLREQISKDIQEAIARTLFFPETQLYYEEYLQTLWCKNNGCKMVYTPNIRVNHMEGQATQTISSSDRLRIKYRMKNIIDSAEIYKAELSKYREAK